LEVQAMQAPQEDVATVVVPVLLLVEWRQAKTAQPAEWPVAGVVRAQ